MSKVNYSTPDTGAWMSKADDLFLARYRGLPCEICKKTKVMYNNRPTRSMGHHLNEKHMVRLHRYEPLNVVVLCAEHHGQHSRSISPHSESTIAVAAFYEWLRTRKPEQWAWFIKHGRDEWDGSWKYKEAYVRLGGQITGELKKDQKPFNHAEAVRNAEKRESTQGES